MSISDSWYKHVRESEIQSNDVTLFVYLKAMLIMLLVVFLLVLLCQITVEVYFTLLTLTLIVSQEYNT